MTYILDILRRTGPDQTPYRQRFSFESQSAGDTVATALTALNAREPLIDMTGAEADPISWSNSCLQRKCGACAMRINDQAALACDTRLKDLRSVIRLEPLNKFPVVRDLMIDRSLLRESLLLTQAFLKEAAQGAGVHSDDAYDASRCLRCGLCLEVCPNYMANGPFMGAVGLTSLTRLMRDAAPDERRRLNKIYREHVYAGCAKSLSCAHVCPAQINTASMLSRSNAVAVWRRLLKDMK